MNRTSFKNLLSILLIGMLMILPNHILAIDGASGNMIWKFEGGYTTFRPYAVNENLFGYSPANSFGSLFTVGITFVGQVNVNRSSTFDEAIGLHFFVPQYIAVKPDTLAYQIGGWELMTSMYGIDLVNSVRANTDLVIAPGICWGAMRLKKYNSTGNFNQFELFRNGFVAPMIRVDLRFQFWKISLGARLSYRYDITSDKWRKGASMTIPGYKYQELQYLFYIGYWMNRK